VRLRGLFLTVCLLFARAASATDLATFIADVENLTRQIETTDADAARALAASLPDTWRIEAAAASANAAAGAGAAASASAGAGAGAGAAEAAKAGAAAGAAFEVRTDWIKAALLQASRTPAQWETRRAALLARLAAVQAEAVALRDAEARAAASAAAAAGADTGPGPDAGASTDANATATANPAARRAVSPAAARAALREVLSRREFARNDTRTWTDALRRQIGKWLDALIDRLGGGPMAAGAVGRTLAWAVAIVALAALMFWLLRMRRRTGRAWQPLALETPRLTSREWAARAAAALRDGDPREAIRCGYHAALFRLEEQGVWRVDDARTPREYLSLLPRHDARRVALADLTRDFELTWYGSRAADARGLIERLEVFGCRVQPESTTASS
jgi:hypothetical protein